MNLSIRLKNIRESKNLSQEYVGNELGIGQPSYSKIENDKREISVKELIKLSDIFDLSIGELLGTENYIVNEYGSKIQEESPKYKRQKGYEISINIKITDPNKEEEILNLIKRLQK